MKHRRLGRTGFEVSEIGLGCWQLGNDFGPVEELEARKILDTAQAQGIDFFDTADVYGAGLSEERIGRWLKGQAQPPVVVTKVGRNAELYPDGYTREKVRRSLEGSARRLGVECLDLAQLHCVPSEVLRGGELLGWMEEFQQQGLIRHFGASVETIDDALFCCEHPKLATLQIIFNLFRQDAVETLLPKAAERDIGIIVRLPLASGLLSGRMSRERRFEAGDHRLANRDGQLFHVGETFNGIPYETGLDLVEELRELLPEGMTMLQLALRWILDQPQVSTIIAGTTRASQVAANAAASGLEPLPQSLHEELKSFYYDRVREHIRGGI
ncbi:aldo/keto reductase [Marinobacterium sp. D7]|uniref:aldo/keto reductase n=1 Tax=Marinobacterium ramblicola TaxID=2849041 RepID=UPI001C2DD93C|nr:aldo/keto reductase [Marinobacterium ramblicola]MBV1790183.1 aldo/keto reductase [Marinobacterium ramblicola]